LFEIQGDPRTRAVMSDIGDIRRRARLLTQIYRSTPRALRLSHRTASSRWMAMIPRVPKVRGEGRPPGRFRWGQAGSPVKAVVPVGIDWSLHFCKH
jgi:hypothetical protein